MQEEQISCIYSVNRLSNDCQSSEQSPTEAQDECTPSETCRLSLNVESSSAQILPLTDEEIFKCNLCEETFSQLSALNMHHSYHNDNPLCTHTEKLFASIVSKKRFSQQGDLQTHLPTHTKEKPFACTVCQKSFSVPSQLKYHLRTHTGEEPFACTVCQKRFSVPSQLKKHVRTHTGEKPFACTVCKKRFSARSNLTTHLRTHRGESFLQSLCMRKGFLKKVI